MISVSRTIAVNPPGIDVVLTREDVWRGLEAKANNALPYVPVMSFCEVAERSGNKILREIEIRGVRFGERVTLEPEESVVFERTFGPVLGTIRNDILEADSGELVLRFSFELELEGAEDDPDAEREHEETMKADYMQGVDATLAAIGRRVGEESQSDTTS